MIGIEGGGGLTDRAEEGHRQAVHEEGDEPEGEEARGFRRQPRDPVHEAREDAGLQLRRTPAGRRLSRRPAFLRDSFSPGGLADVNVLKYSKMVAGQVVQHLLLNIAVSVGTVELSK